MEDSIEKIKRLFNAELYRTGNSAFRIRYASRYDTRYPSIVFQIVSH